MRQDGFSVFFPYTTVTGIFWDYENVPLRHQDYDAFLQGLIAFVRATRMIYAKVYSREKTMPDSDYKLLAKLEIFQFKWVTSDDPNAADYFTYSILYRCPRR
ncbi:MAG: hypothetical protein ACFFBD_30510 [Candidatus Hodarchaeota archaeon]